MPELPEVETVRRGLHALIIGKRIVSVGHDTPKSFPNAAGDVEEFLLGAMVTDVRRRAKVLLIDLNTGYSLVTHLKMTGQLVFVAKNQQRLETRDQRLETPADRQTLTSKLEPLVSIEADEVRFGAGHPNDSLISKLPDKSTRVTITFVDDSKLFFNDQRKFGWMRLFPTIEIPNIEFFKKVGPEPLDSNFQFPIFNFQIQKRRNSIVKAALLDQTVVAGIGNIYADESLWGAKIHPAAKVRDIPAAKLRSLYKEIRYVLELAIEKGGSTDRNYVNAEGKKGSYIDFARVFRREGLACPRHPGTLIIKTKVAGRGTHICPKCQKLQTFQQ